MATTTQSFYVVKRKFYVSRNGLNGYQWYCSHMTTRKSDKKHIFVVKWERALNHFIDFPCQTHSSMRSATCKQCPRLTTVYSTSVSKDKKNITAVMTEKWGMFGIVFLFLYHPSWDPLRCDKNRWVRRPPWILPVWTDDQNGYYHDSREATDHKYSDPDV